MRLYSFSLVVIPSFVLASASVASAAPQIFWASDPVRPNETVLIQGSDFGTAPIVEIARLADEKPTAPIFPSTRPSGPGAGGWSVGTTARIRRARSERGPARRFFRRPIVR